MSRLFDMLVSSLAVVAVACATGATDPASDDDDDTGGAGVGAGGSTTTTTTTTSSSETTTTTDTGGSGPECGPTQHMCGGVCAENTPQTGCYASTACTPCTPVPNGTTLCTAEGACDFNCIAPYQKSGAHCVCPTECCASTDCDTDGTCSGGECLYPCDPLVCEITCLASGAAAGFCFTDYECTCIA